MKDSRNARCSVQLDELFTRSWASIRKVASVVAKGLPPVPVDLLTDCIYRQKLLLNGLLPVKK